MTENKNEPLPVWVYWAVIVVITIFVYLRSLKVESKNSYYYTIGTIVSETISDGRFCNYEYSVHHKKFTNGNGCNGECMCDVGKRFYITFLKDSPKHSWLHLDKPVPDSIKTVPPEGWYGNLDSLFKKTNENAKP